MANRLEGDTVRHDPKPPQGPAEITWEKSWGDGMGGPEGYVTKAKGDAALAEMRTRIAELEALVDALTDEVSDDRDLYDGVHTRIAELDAALAQRERMLESLRLSIVRRKQEAALYGDGAEWEGLAIALGLVDDALGRARAEKKP